MTTRRRRWWGGSGAVALAAPTFNHNGEVAGCLGVFGPRARVKDTDVPRFGAHASNVGTSTFKRGGHKLMHLLRFMPFHKIWCVAIAAE